MYMSSDSVISIKDLGYKYPLGPTIFDGLSYELQKGEFHILLGKNGTGKSTLLHLIMGFRTPINGEIQVLGMNPIKEHKVLKQKIAYIAHDISIPKELTVRMFLDYNACFFESYDKGIETKSLDSFEIDESKGIYQLSAGQKNRVLLISAFSRNAELIVVDEMTAVLDPVARYELNEILNNKRRESNCSILLATNIPEDVTSHVDKAFFIKNATLSEGQTENLMKEY